MNDLKLEMVGLRKKCKRSMEKEEFFEEFK